MNKITILIGLLCGAFVLMVPEKLSNITVGLIVWILAIIFILRWFKVSGH